RIDEGVPAWTRAAVAKPKWARTRRLLPTLYDRSGKLQEILDQWPVAARFQADDIGAREHLGIRDQ
ncbi:MAG: hypothetical protein OXF88_02335, partial [Rhodobacteraceae bacterium]|nr:hypothetical protein [Paracoccaceae bacterium]